MRGAGPLHGVPLQGPTDLRLLVADVPAPFVLDVDRGTTQPISGLPAGGDRGIGSYPAAGGSDPSSAVLEPDGGRIPLRDRQPRPVAGDLVLSGADRSVPLVLTDMGSGASHRLSWPSRPDYSLGEATADPNGRLAVVEFANAAQQRLDLWLLDTATRRWQHLPEMPASLSPKATDVQWTADGRMVLLDRAEIAVWRPGEPRFAVRRVKPPTQPDRRFVIW